MRRGTGDERRATGRGKRPSSVGGLGTRAEAVETTVALAGSGAVARAVGRGLHRRGWTVAAVASRRLTRARAAAAFIGGNTVAVPYEELPRHAARILVAVSDRAVATVAHRLAASMRGGVAVHTCGARGADLLEPLARVGVSCGAWHPLCCVPARDEGQDRLAGAACAIDGRGAASAFARRLTRAFGGRLLVIAPEDRAMYHAAAALAANHTMGVLHAAIELLVQVGIRRADARRALVALLSGGLASVDRLGLPRALTGPIVRGDLETVCHHLEALAAAPAAARRLYRDTARYVVSLAGLRGLDPTTASRMVRVLQRDETRRHG